MQQKMMATTVGKKSMTVPRVLPSSKTDQASCRALLIVYTGKASIAAAAETVSLAFAEDPLIEFLYKRPKQQTWASLSPSTQKWQQNRLRHYQLDSNIFEVRVNGLNAGLCILHPPKTWRRLFSCAWIVRYFKAIIFRWINAGSEECCNQNVCQKSAWTTGKLTVASAWASCSHLLASKAQRSLQDTGQELCTTFR